jgi:F420 biosynthesis protein FbiB-like protein
MHSTMRHNPAIPDIISRRQSVRRFRPSAVAPSLVQTLIDAAALAPSAHGRQPWLFVVIAPGAPRQRLIVAMAQQWEAHLRADGSDDTTITKRIDASQQRISDAPLLFLPCIDTSRLDHYPDLQRQHAEYMMAVQSMGCAIQNLLLTAVYHGLDAGWMCAPLFCQQAVRAACDMPAHLDPQALIPCGYMAQPPKRRPKRAGHTLRHDVPNTTP